MTVSSQTITRSENLPGITMYFGYKIEDFEEIINNRKFDAESLFGQIGGFIGITLGISFFNMPDILLAVVKTFHNKINQIMDC